MEKLLLEIAQMGMYDYLQLIGGLILAIFYVPSIIAVYKAKTTKELSLTAWVMLLLGLCCMLANATHLYITVGTLSYLIAETINVVFCLVFVLEIIYFRYFYKGGK